MRLNGTKVFLLLSAVAILLFAGAYCFSLFPEKSTIGEDQYRLNLEQPLMGGKIILDKVWLHQNKPEFLRISGRFLGVDPVKRYFVDSRVREMPEGFENGAMSWYVPMPSTADMAGIPFIFEYKAPPIAAKKCYVRVYLREKSLTATPPKLVAMVDFEFSNPLRRQPERLGAEAVPALRKADPLEVQLTGIETGLFAPWKKSGLQSGLRESYSRLTLRVTEGGKLTTAWRPMHYTFSGGTGVTVEDEFGSGCGLYGNTDAMFAGTLWPTEGAWRVHVKLMRTNDFHPDEIIEIQDLPVPAKGGVVRLETEWKRGDLGVKFLGITGGGVKVKEWNIENEKTGMYVCFQTFKRCWLKLLSITDEQGNPVYVPNEEYRRSYKPGDPVYFSFHLNPEMHPKKLNIKCGLVWEQREVDFVVNPVYSGLSNVPRLD